METASGHTQEIELDIISSIIDNTPTISDYVLQDLTKDKTIIKHTGADGMSADQVLDLRSLSSFLGFLMCNWLFIFTIPDPCADFVVSDLPIKALKNQLLTQTLNA